MPEDLRPGFGEARRESTNDHEVRKFTFFLRVFSAFFVCLKKWFFACFRVPFRDISVIFTQRLQRDGHEAAVPGVLGVFLPRVSVQHRAAREPGACEYDPRDERRGEARAVRAGGAFKGLIWA